MKNELLDKGIITPPGEISKDKISPTKMPCYILRWQIKFGDSIIKRRIGADMVRIKYNELSRLNETELRKVYEDDIIRAIIIR